MESDTTINVKEENRKLDMDILLHGLKEILKPKDQIISLIVKADSLYNSEKPDQIEIDKYSILEDDEHSSQLAPLKNFISEVSIGKYVSWDGQSIDPEYSVLIENITYKHDFLEETQPISGSEGKVKVKIKNDKELVGKFYEYKINFSIWENGVAPKFFMIDPKLCANN